MLSIRTTNLAIFVATVALILAAVYMEHVMKLEPCPLCITQRAFFILTGLFGLAAFLQNPKTLGRRVYAGLGILSAIAGAGFAGRQIWLQSLPPDQVPACGASLAYMLENFPLYDVFKTMLQGDGSCAEVQKVFGLSIPKWSFIAFAGLFAANLFQGVRKA